MNQIIIHPDARKELISTVNYYNDLDVGLKNQIIQEIKRSLKLIKLNPNRWRIIKKNVRRYLIQKFPYSVYYRLDSDTIFIVAFAHNKRKPFYWMNRVS